MLLDLAAELAPAFLADLLGMHVNTCGPVGPQRRRRLGRLRGISSAKVTGTAARRRRRPPYGARASLTASASGPARRRCSVKLNVLFTSGLGKNAGGTKLALPAAHATHPVASVRAVIAKPRPPEDAMDAWGLVH